MYKQIKELADEAIALQNKDAMDQALREISALCAAPVSVEDLERAAGASLIGFTAAAEVHGDPIVEPSQDADAYKAMTEEAKSAKPAPAAKPAKKGGAK